MLLIAAPNFCAKKGFRPSRKQKDFLRWEGQLCGKFCQFLKIHLTTFTAHNGKKHAKIAQLEEFMELRK
jgi:hypothetical protein